MSCSQPDFEQTIKDLYKRVEDIEKRLIPIDPLIDMQLAAVMVPMKYMQLVTFLRHRKDQFPPVYRLETDRKRRRVLSVSDIRKIREHILKGPGKHRYV